jgi:hypothetical protein
MSQIWSLVQVTWPFLQLAFSWHVKFVHVEPALHWPSSQHCRQTLPLQPNWLFGQVVHVAEAVLQIWFCAHVTWPFTHEGLSTHRKFPSHMRPLGQSFVSQHSRQTLPLQPLCPGAQFTQVALPMSQIWFWAQVTWPFLQLAFSWHVKFTHMKPVLHWPSSQHGWQTLPRQPNCPFGQFMHVAEAVLQIWFCAHVTWPFTHEGLSTHRKFPSHMRPLGQSFVSQHSRQMLLRQPRCPAGQAMHAAEAMSQIWFFAQVTLPFLQLAFSWHVKFVHMKPSLQSPFPQHARQTLPQAFCPVGQFVHDAEAMLQIWFGPHATCWFTHDGLSTHLKVPSHMRPFVQSVVSQHSRQTLPRQPFCPVGQFSHFPVPMLQTCPLLHLMDPSLQFAATLHVPFAQAAPAGHSVSLQQVPQVLFPHSFCPAGQAYWQTPPVQAATWLPFFPHWPLLQHSWHAPLQRKAATPHLRSHFVPSQVAVAPAPVGQGEQDVGPHELMLLLSTHWSPQRWKPGEHLKSHLPPSHVAFALGWRPHGVQEPPQLAVSLSGTQLPAQSWLPAGHWVSQDLPAGRHSPLQSVIPAGQDAPHIAPSQVAVPPTGTVQGEQPVPQVRGSLSRTQLFPQAWWPSLQVRTHWSPSHVVCPNVEVGQVTQAVPQALTLVASTQMPLQALVPGGQGLSQAAPWSTHLSMQGFCPGGHSTPHFTESQVLFPPVKDGHATQAKPQWLGSLLSTQTPAQMCDPAGHSEAWKGSAAPGSAAPGPSEAADPVTLPSDLAGAVGGQSLGSAFLSPQGTVVRGARQPLRDTMTRSGRTNLVWSPMGATPVIALCGYMNWPAV